MTPKDKMFNQNQIFDKICRSYVVAMFGPGWEKDSRIKWDASELEGMVVDTNSTRNLNYSYSGPGPSLTIACHSRTGLLENPQEDMPAHISYSHTGVLLYYANFIEGDPVDKRNGMPQSMSFDKAGNVTEAEFSGPPRKRYLRKEAADIVAHIRRNSAATLVGRTPDVVSLQQPNGRSL